MKPALAAKTLQHMIAVKQPTFLWGPPGVGKSSIVRQVADTIYGGDGKENIVHLKRRPMTKAPAKKAFASNDPRPYFIDLRLPLLDAVDLRGIPMERDGSTVWLRPSFLPTEGAGVLFLDELVQAMPIVQSAASQLILDRRIGEYYLPDGWVVIAAGNRDTDRAATQRMPSHIANRFTHINIEVDFNDWNAWAIDNSINTMVRAFLAFRPNLLHNFVPAEKAFPTPRSWEFVSKILSNGVDDECFMEVVSGTVGEAAAKEFTGFIRVFRELPTYEEVIKKPSDTPVPDNAAAKYGVTTMLAGQAQQRDMKPIVMYLERMEEEFQIRAMNNMTRRSPELAETSSYIRWASEHQASLLNR